MTHSYSPEAFRLLNFYGYHYNAFYSTSASFASLLYSTYKSLIHFNIAGQLLAFVIDHDHTKTMQHCPRNTICYS